MTTHLREVAENKHMVSLDIQGVGALADVLNTSWRIYFHLAGCRSNQPAGESLVNQMSEARTESQPEFIATEKLINYPFQSAITFDMPNKFNWFLGK